MLKFISTNDFILVVNCGHVDLTNVQNVKIAIAPNATTYGAEATVECTQNDLELFSLFVLKTNINCRADGRWGLPNKDIPSCVGMYFYYIFLSRF